MLGALEKIVWGLSIVVILACGGWVGYAGLPSTTPKLALGSKKITEQQLKLPPEAKADVDAQRAGIDIGDDGPIERPGGKRKRPTTVFQVDRNVEERLGNLNDCIAEMNFASSEVQADGTLKVFDIQEGSLLEKVGLQNNDVIERIGGMVIDFSDTQACHNTWQENLERLKGGTPIVVEMKRNGTVQQLIISPGM